MAIRSRPNWKEIVTSTAFHRLRRVAEHVECEVSFDVAFPDGWIARTASAAARAYLRRDTIGAIEAIEAAFLDRETVVARRVDEAFV